MVHRRAPGAGAARPLSQATSWASPQDVAAAAEKARAAGMTAVKMNATAEMHYLDSEPKVEEAAERLNPVWPNDDGTVAEW